MPILLSNGTQLHDTGVQDSRGFNVLVDDNGIAYTNQGGQYIRGGSVGTNINTLSAILGGLTAKGDPTSRELLQSLQSQFQASLPPQAAFKVTPLADLISGARQDSSATYFAPDKKLLEDSLATAEAQARATKQLQEQFQQTNYKSYLGIQDRGFASALQSAQNGYAGRGTSTSGFRTKAVGNFFTDKSQQLADAAAQQEQTTSSRNLQFTQFLDQQSLQKRQGELALQRQEEAKALAVAQAKQAEEQAKNAALLSPFAAFLSNKAAA